MEKHNNDEKSIKNITNNFGGATIFNMVMNQTSNNMFSDNGNTESDDQQEHGKERIYSDAEVARAIETICGDGLPLNSKKRWGGVYWYLRWACNYPVNIADFCRRVKGLPFSGVLAYDCDYNNLRPWGTVSFMNQDARQLDMVKPSKMDEPAFYDCRTVVTALQNALTEARQAPVDSTALAIR